MDGRVTEKDIKQVCLNFYNVLFFLGIKLTSTERILSVFCCFGVNVIVNLGPFQIILLTACTNKLSVTHEEAEDYAALVMEVLDEEKQGYVEVLLYISISFSFKLKINFILFKQSEHGSTVIISMYH